MSAILMATRQWVLSQINQNVASVFKWGGEVASVTNLPGYDSSNADTLKIKTSGEGALTNPVVGTVYNVTDTGANYVIVKRTANNVDSYFWDKLSENDYATLKNRVGTLETNLSTLDGAAVKKASLVDLSAASGKAETAVKASSLFSNIIAISNVDENTADYAIAGAKSVKAAVDASNTRIAALEALLDTSDSSSTISSILSRISTNETNISTNATNISSLNNDLGSVNNLSENLKSGSIGQGTSPNLVTAVNYIYSLVNTNTDAIGALSSLETTAQSTIVAAINELHSDLSTLSSNSIPTADIIGFSAATASTTVGTKVADAATFKKAINDVDTKVGTLSNLTTTAKNNVVAAVNEVKGTADAALPKNDVVAYANAATGKAADSLSFKTEIESAKSAASAANTNAESRVAKTDIATSVRASTQAVDTKVTSEKAIATEKENLLDGTTSFTTLSVDASGKIVLKGTTKDWYLKIDETEGTLSLEEAAKA